MAHLDLDTGVGPVGCLRFLSWVNQEFFHPLEFNGGSDILQVLELTTFFQAHLLGRGCE